MSILKLLKDEEKRLELKLKDLRKKSDMKVLSKGFTCLERSNKALQKYLNTKQDKFMKWAEMWNNAKKHFVKLGLEQSKNNYFIDEMVQTESDLSEIKNRIFFESRR